MNKLFLCIIAAVLCTAGCATTGPSPIKSYKLHAGIDAVATQLVAGIPADKPLTIAVIDFTDLQGYTDDLGRYVATHLDTRLSQQTGRFKLVQRKRLSDILRELKFGTSGVIDVATAKRIGKMLGADSLVLGSITDTGDELDINARVVEVETGNTLPGAMVLIKKDEKVRSLLGRGLILTSSAIETSQIVYIYNKGSTPLVYVELKNGKPFRQPRIVKKRSIQPITYMGFDLLALEATTYDENGKPSSPPTRERFSDGTWVWIFDGDSPPKKTRDMSVLPLR